MSYRNYQYHYWTSKMLVRYIQLSFMQYMGLCVISLPISLMMIVRICVLYLITIIKSEVWPICHCLGLGHETMKMRCMFFFFFYILLINTSMLKTKWSLPRRYFETYFPHAKLFCFDWNWIVFLRFQLIASHLVMAWHKTGDKPISQPILMKTHDSTWHQ